MLLYATPLCVYTQIKIRRRNVASSVQASKREITVISISLLCADACWHYCHVSLQAMPAWHHSWRGQPYRSWRSLPGTGHRQLSSTPQQPESLTDTGHISGGQLTRDTICGGPHSDDAAHHADVRRYNGRICERLWPMWWGFLPPVCFTLSPSLSYSRCRA